VTVQNEVRPGEVQDVWVTGDVARVVSESLAPVVRGRQPRALQEGAPGAVEYENSLIERACNGCGICHVRPPLPASGLEETRIPRDSLGVFVLVAKLSSNSVQVTRELTRPTRAKRNLISHLRRDQQ